MCIVECVRFHYILGCFHINTETYDSVYSSIKCMRKATSVFRIHCTQFLSGSTQYFLSNTVDHILIGRSHIGRAPKILYKTRAQQISHNRNKVIKYVEVNNFNNKYHKRSNKTLVP